MNISIRFDPVLAIDPQTFVKEWHQLQNARELAFFEAKLGRGHEYADPGGIVSGFLLGVVAGVIPNAIWDAIKLASAKAAGARFRTRDQKVYTSEADCPDGPAIDIKHRRLEDGSIEVSVLISRASSPDSKKA